MTPSEFRQAEAEYCRNDPVYFVENYCHIEDKDADELIQPFTLWPGHSPGLRWQNRRGFWFCGPAEQ